MHIKLYLAVTIILFGLSPIGHCIPQNFGGNLFGATFVPRKIANDFTDKLIATSLWKGNKLPGDWKRIPSIDQDNILRLTVSPVVFGSHPSSVYANYEGQELRSISIMYLDSEEFIRKKTSNNINTNLTGLKREFRKNYNEISSKIEDQLYKTSKSTPSDAFVGNTKFLRNYYDDYQIRDLTIRLCLKEDNSISLIILRSKDVTKSYLSTEAKALDKNERRKKLEKNVLINNNGDRNIIDIPIFQQGRRPYCAVNTLGMATYYLGLRMSTDALAAGAKFRYIDSAKGSKMLDLYRAAAEESEATLQRGRSFDFKRAQKYLEKGLPIIVWRRFSFYRDQLHSAAAKGAKLPAPTKEDRGQWPISKDDPGHASVITGFNKDTGEVIFMESWGENARNKRMLANELEATSYATFYFKI